MANGSSTEAADGLRTLVPALALQIETDPTSTNALWQSIDGSLLSADISGFTRLTESLAARGREGAEVITAVVNACFEDLIAAAERFGGDVIKFGGDAVLVFYRGPQHQARSIAAAREMQLALRSNTEARRYQLLMTVGVNDGPFDAMVIGSRRRDVLICGPNTTHTLELEGAAEQGEVVASRSAIATAETTAESRAGGVVLHSESLLVEPALLTAADDINQIARFVHGSMRSYYNDYANQGAQHRQAAIGFVVIDGVDDHIAAHGGQVTANELSNLIDEVDRVLEPTGVSVLHSDMSVGAVKLAIGAGVPSASGDHADALVYAALALARIDTPFVIRQGLQVGTVFAGFLGAEHRRTFTVMGDAVNTAARMSSRAAGGEIIAVQDVAQRTRGHVEGVALEPFMVKGKNEPVSALQVVSIGAAEERDAENQVPFAGRDPEVVAIREAVEGGSSASIVGPAGSGKTRLGEEAIDTDQALVATGGRYIAATPYAAFWSAMRAQLGIDLKADALTAGAALVAKLAAIAPSVTVYAPLIAPAFAAEVASNETVEALAPEFRRDVLHRELTTVLSSIEPEVSAVVAEDVQWLDDASGELLEHLERVGPANGWVVIRTGRDTNGDSDPSKSDPGDGDPGDAEEPGGVSVLLGPLAPSAVESIITDACPRRLLRHELEALVARAGGNPLFAIELALAAALPGSDLPGSIEELIIARIDRLPPRERSAVRLASVFGARFDPIHFRAVAETGGYDLELDIGSIEEIFTIEDGMAHFRQGLYRDAAYGSLPFARRKRLHLAVGDYLEATVEDSDAIATLLSQHFALAQDRRRCWRYSTQAADRAQRQHSPADAEVLYRRAIDLAPRQLDPDARTAAFEGLADALVSTGSLAEAHELFGKARRTATTDAEKLRLLGRQGLCRQRQGRFSDALRVFTRMLKAADDDPESQAVALNGRAAVNYRLGRAAEAFESATEALAVADESDLVAEQVQALKLMHTTAEMLGHGNFGGHADRALVLARELGDLSLEAEIMNNVGVSEQLAGALKPAAQAYRKSFELKQRVGDRAGAAMVQMNLSEVELDRGVTTGVEDLLQECIAEFDVAGFTIGSTYSQGLLGRCALLVGDSSTAADLLEGAAASFTELGGDSYAADMELMLIEAHLALGQLDQARPLLVKNRALLEGGTVFENPDAAAARVRVLEQQLERLSNA